MVLFGEMTKVKSMVNTNLLETNLIIFGCMNYNNLETK